MASTVPLVREYTFVELRLEMAIQQNSLTSSAIICRYRNRMTCFPIGGLVDIGETPIAPGSRYYRQLINFEFKPHDRLCLFPVQKESKDLMLGRISLYILDVKAECLTMLYF
jgi:hypothetical protein